jgi:hypothetical protein
MVRLVWCLLVLGLGLLALSWIWPVVAGGGPGWNQQQAEEHAHAAADLHQRQGAAEHGQQPDPQALESARQRYNASDARLQAAQQRGAGIATLLRWTGIIFALSGLAGYFVFCQKTAG